LEQEGRRARRLATDIPGFIQGRTRREVRVVDLSRTGCLVRCGGRLDAGAILDLVLSLDGEPFEAKVRVAEVSLDGTAPETEPCCLAGLEFLTPAAHDETRLLAFLQRELRRQ
jgi:hypothetical protein